MNKEEYRYDMDKFTSSNKFLHKKITREGDFYKDKGTNTVFAIEINSLKEIKEIFSELRNPVILLSKNKDLLNILTKVFNSDNWTEERIENLSGEEFDYIYLRQCNLLGLDKSLPFEDKR